MSNHEAIAFIAPLPLVSASGRLLFPAALRPSNHTSRSTVFHVEDYAIVEMTPSALCSEPISSQVERAVVSTKPSDKQSTFCTTKNQSTKHRSNPDGMLSQRQGAKVGRGYPSLRNDSEAPCLPDSARLGLPRGRPSADDRKNMRSAFRLLLACDSSRIKRCEWRESSMGKIRDQRPGNRHSAFWLLLVPTPTVSTV